MRKLKTFIKILLGKRLVCKYIYKKHEYQYRSTQVERYGKYKSKVHIRCCKHCNHCKRISV